MTYEELLQVTDGLLHLGPSAQALKAVVELHQPAWYREDKTDEPYCVGCDRCGCYEGDILGENEWKNCPTIKAIEKELA